MKDYLSVADLTPAALERLLQDAAGLKRDPQKASLPGRKAAALLFELPSLRTRTSYEVALMHLGGRAVIHDTLFKERESAADIGRTLSELVSAIVVRVRDHELLEILADSATVPVVNALSGREHPVEVLADALTIRQEWSHTKGRKLAYLGDGNNICHSLLLLGPLMGMDTAVAGPERYQPAEMIVRRGKGLADRAGTKLEILDNPVEAVRDADVVYTDVWASMGQEDSAEERRKAFQPYQVNAELMSRARPDAIVLHCLPARRGEEITADVIEGPQSRAFSRLSNLVPVTAALLRMLME